jgi:hypothetical protein
MSLVIRSPLIRAVLIARSLAAVIGAAMTSTAGLLVLALLLLFPVVTSLSQAGRLAATLQSFRRRAVQAIVWGRPIPRPQAAELRVESIGAVGAGLLIYLADAGEPKTLLKVAQPRSWQVGDGRVIIDEAAYVQWAGKRLERAEGFPALAISLVASGVT